MLHLPSICDVPLQCSCGWSGTVGKAEPDIDGDGGLGCPDCFSVLDCRWPVSAEGSMKPGRELDALVAEKIFNKRVVREPVMMHDPNQEGAFKEVLGFYEVANHSTTFNIPPYSTDIAAAWEVVEKMMNGTMPDEVRQRQSWRIFYDEMEDTNLVDLSASQAAEFICLAALKAVGVDVENA